MWTPCLDWKLKMHSYWYIGTLIKSSPLAMSQAMPYDLKPFLDIQLDIYKLHVGDFNGWCLLFWLHPYYLLLPAIDIFESGLSIYHRSMPWDPGSLALLLLCESGNVLPRCEATCCML